MTKLAPDLFQRRFSDLMEIGRARLPELAPEWTDHNAHDPGITLMELLAWVSEAQLYSLSRLRRDERLAYAALLGIASSGTRSASGLIWPDHTDPNSPAAIHKRTVLLSKETLIHPVDTEEPTFRPQHSLLWVAGRIERLETRKVGNGGNSTDHTATNRTGGVTFLPFGQRAGRRDVLALTFECRDKDGLFGSERQLAYGSLWPIGVMADSGGGALESTAIVPKALPSPLSATLVTEDRRIDLNISSDSTRGLLTSGAILLNLDNVSGSPKRFTLELRSRSGFPRPPRVLRIEPNVIPIEQGRRISQEVHDSKGWPNTELQLQESGLRFSPGEEPVSVEVAEPNGVLTTWRRCTQLLAQGPQDNAYELDTTSGTITFGNGVNGRIPRAESQIWISYSVSDGRRGRVARNRKWKVAGFQAAFGVNPTPIAGGSDPSGFLKQRREARHRSKHDHALVSENDLVSAALKLPLLEVARAWVPKSNPRLPRTGTITLVALRERASHQESERAPETARWQETVRRQLAPRIPLGSRLVVVAPEYRDFTIVAQLETELERDPAAVKKSILDKLKERLALVETTTAAPLRQPGVPVTRRDIVAWTRSCDGVLRVTTLELRDASGTIQDEINVSQTGLPRWNARQSTIEVMRPGSGRRA